MPPAKYRPRAIFNSLGDTVRGLEGYIGILGEVARGEGIVFRLEEVGYSDKYFITGPVYNLKEGEDKLEVDNKEA